MTSGKVLHETRERKGYDLTTVARRLRIRPDILRAIEAGDFASMPPRGYTRNMVNAYARLLGLNPTEIVNMYLDEAYAAQVERARDSAPSSGFDMSRSHYTTRMRSRHSGTDNGVTQGSESRRMTYDAGNGSYTRDLYDDRTQFSRDDYGVTRERMERPGKSDRDFMSHHSGYGDASFGVAAARGGSANRTGRVSRSGRSGSRRGDVHVGSTPMSFTASRLPAFLQTRAALIAVIAVVVVAIVVVVFLAFGNRGAPADDDVSKLPVSGINDTTGVSDGSAATGLVEVAPTSSRVVISVSQGKECYLEAHSNNVTTPYSLVGPAEENVEVTGVWTITTWTPENVKITVDGTEVKLAASDAYGGMYAYTVDFPAILEQWRTTHTSREAQRSAAVATAETGAAQSGASVSAQSMSTTQQEPQMEEEENPEDEEEAPLDEEEEYVDEESEEDYYSDEEQ